MTSTLLNEADLSLQMYEAQAIIIEKDSEIQLLKKENEKLRQEVENSNRNHQGLARKEPDNGKMIDDLSEKVESLSLKHPRNQVELAQEANNNSYSINRLESLELQMKELMKAICVKNQRLETLEVNVTKITVSNAENSQLKEEMTASKLNQARIDRELSQKVTKLEQDLAVSKTENLRLSNKFENFDKNQTIHFEELSQKVKKLEQDLTASKTDNVKLREKLEQNLLAASKKFELKEQITSALQLNANLSNVTQEKAQSENKSENKVEKQSGGQQNASVLILGGYNGLNTIILLDSKAQIWKKVSITLPVGMRNFGAVVLNEEIYIFGGKQPKPTNGNFTYHQHCYKLKDDGSWVQLASMNQKRAYISSSSLVYKGDIWAIGGHSGDVIGYLNSVERYDISQDKWAYMPEMNSTRWNAAAAVFKNQIFITGGLDGKNLLSVEMFDPKLQKWIFFCDLPFEVTGHTMLINNSILSIFGGGSESYDLNSVWEMNLEYPKKGWIEKENFKFPRKHFGIGKLSNGIIVFGDACGTSEVFDGSEWIDGPELPQELACFAYTSIPRSLEERFLEKFS